MVAQMRYHGIPVDDEDVKALSEAALQDKLCIFVGAGVSLATLGPGAPSCATWSGLLLSGVERIAKLGLKDVNWLMRKRQAIEQGEPGEHVALADEVQRILQDTGFFSDWLESTVGRFAPFDSRLISQLAKLSSRIITTNYDGLLSIVTGRPPVTLADPRFARALDGNQILHIHGHWQHPATVVLGAGAYGRLESSQHLQDVLKSLHYANTIVFIGYGGGLRDPTLATYLRWIASLGGAVRLTYVLVRRKEMLPAGGSIVHVGYGEEYKDLLPFLERLMRSTPTGPAVPACQGVGYISNDASGADVAEVIVKFDKETPPIPPGGAADAVARSGASRGHSVLLLASLVAPLILVLSWICVARTRDRCQSDQSTLKARFSSRPSGEAYDEDITLSIALDGNVVVESPRDVLLPSTEEVLTEPLNWGSGLGCDVFVERFPPPTRMPSVCTPCDDVRAILLARSGFAVGQSVTVNGSVEPDGRVVIPNEQREIPANVMARLRMPLLPPPAEACFFQLDVVVARSEVCSDDVVRQLRRRAIARPKSANEPMLAFRIAESGGVSLEGEYRSLTAKMRGALTAPIEIPSGLRIHACRAAVAWKSRTGGDSTPSSTPAEPVLSGGPSDPGFLEPR